MGWDQATLPIPIHPSMDDANSHASYIPQRSSPDALLEVPNKSRNELGDATFATYAPKIIKIRLKTYLYTVAFTAT